MPIQHGTITGDAVHVPYAGTFANAAARTGATGLDSTQHGKLFRQLDDNSLWMLVSTSPLTWKSLSPDRVASAGYADNAGYANNAGTLNSKVEGSLSVNYANSAGSVGMAGNTTSIGGARGIGTLTLENKDQATKWIVLTVPSGGTWEVLGDQRVDTGLSDVVIELKAGSTYPGGARIMNAIPFFASGALNPTGGIFYRI
ncbi:hypothetical protein [Bilophila wadsworthia]|uniref:hypothetical protein n=1 Tax=Bilophila wadsworthia TaxID=35833 RepID=UPI003AB19BE6